MKWNRIWLPGVFGVMMAASYPVQAHIGGSITTGWTSGIMHPLSGGDHLIASIAVGMWAAQYRGRALWAVIFTFLTAMFVGGCTGMLRFGIPSFEIGVVASVLVLGYLLFAAIRLPWVAGCFMVGTFALFHGHAHGVETTASLGGITYLMGMVVMTGLLQLCGLGVVRLLTNMKPVGVRTVRYLGGAITAYGVYLLLAVI